MKQMIYVPLFVFLGVLAAYTVVQVPKHVNFNGASFK